MRVFVYYNLHKHVWSIKALEGPNKGRVVAHAANVWLDNAAPRVSQSGRTRVLRERKKNVHAGITGVFHSCDNGPAIPQPHKWSKARYNPYEGPCFTLSGPSVAVEWPEDIYADRVVMSHKQVFVN